MGELFQTVLTNLTDVGIGVLLFVMAYVSNMALGLYYNIKVLNQPFDVKKLIDSALKIAAFGIGTGLLCVCLTTIPAFATHVGFVIPDEYSTVFQDLAILSVFIISSCKYLLEAYNKFAKILKTSSVEA
jgi:hypothetical protein